MRKRGMMDEFSSCIQGEKMLCALPYSAESLRTNCGPQPITRVILHDTLSRGLVGSPFVSGHLAYQTRPTDCRPI